MKTVKITYEQFIDRSQLIFAHPMPILLRNILQYLEFVIVISCYNRDCSRLKNTSKSKMITNQFKSLLQNMDCDEILDYYWLFSDCVFEFTNGKSTYQKQITIATNSKTNVYLKFETDCQFQKYIIESTPCLNIICLDNQYKPTKYLGLSSYMYRKSKNKQYFAFVLEACDKRVPQQLRKITMGFKDKNIYENIFILIKQSINNQIKKRVRAMYEGDSLLKTLLIARSNPVFGKNCSNNQKICNQAEQQQKEQFYSCQSIQSKNQQISQKQYFQQNNQQQILKEHLFKNSKINIALNKQNCFQTKILIQKDYFQKIPTKPTKYKRQQNQSLKLQLIKDITKIQINCNDDKQNIQINFATDKLKENCLKLQIKSQSEPKKTDMLNKQLYYIPVNII